MKVKWMLEKVIHEDSTKYIAENLRAGMNKRKTATVYTPALATPQAESYTQFGGKAITDTNLLKTLQLLLHYDQEEEKNFSLFEATYLQKLLQKIGKNLARPWMKLMS